MSGRARLYTYSVVHQAPHPSFAVPYVYAIVQLEEGVKIPTNIVDCPLEDLQIDMPLAASYDDLSPDWTLIKFRPA